MTQAAAAGARLIHFCEGALCTPHKRILSSDPDRMAAADWTRFDWATQQDELRAIAEHARSLRLWTVAGAVHRLTEPHRPHNSLYVIDDRGQFATRYDERMLSNTKLSYMYTPGTSPIIFEVDGVRCGCALGMESQYPERFAEYERAGVHCVLLSTMDNGATFALQAQGHASVNSYWTSYATCTADSDAAPSGVVDPTGTWVTRCSAGEAASIALADVDRDHEQFARPWRRKARGDLYAAAIVSDDPRLSRDSF
jgi:predicted amidohydrolase